MNAGNGLKPDRSGNRRVLSVAASDVGRPLVTYLTARFTYQNHEEWSAHILSGRITVDGKSCDPGLTLAEGAVIAFDPPEIPEPEVPCNWRVLLEDERFLFVDKPAGLPSHPAGRYRHNTLWSFLSRDYRAVHLVNRLDRETSGIVVAAKSPEAAGEAARSMTGDAWVKEYRVAVRGSFPERLDAEGWLSRDESSPVRKARRFTPNAPGEGTALGGAEYARTRFHLLRRLGGLSEIRAELLTGRTHQIRATLLSLGWPVVGDKIYGGDPTLFIRFIAGELSGADRAFLRMNRQALHCERIAFTSEGRAYDVSCEPPPDWPFRNGR